jgi:hypothetical protein
LFKHCCSPNSFYHFLTLRDLYPLFSCSVRQNVSTVIVANGKKVDISKQGLNSIENKTVKLNLMGKSETMKQKDWVDPSGRKGKVRFYLNNLFHIKEQRKQYLAQKERIFPDSSISLHFEISAVHFS